MTRKLLQRLQNLVVGNPDEEEAADTSAEDSPDAAPANVFRSLPKVDGATVERQLT